MNKILVQIKQISEVKELFLSLCLVGGEISKQTVLQLKKDYGNNYIKRNIIYSLIHSGIIEKVTYHKDYGYILTDKGLEYMKIKYPVKYYYDDITLSKSKVYKENLHYRAKTLTHLLYYLVKQGVVITNHYADIYNLVNGYEIEVKYPFFVSVKQMQSVSERIAASWGTRAYGFIISKDSINVVYAPDKEHNLYANMESTLYYSLIGLQDELSSPYNERGNLRVLYVYNTLDDIVDSFKIKAKDTNEKARVAQTRRCYQRLEYLNSNIIYTKNDINFSTIINSEAYREKINEVSEANNLRYTIQSRNLMYADGIIGNDVATVLCYVDVKKLMYLLKYGKKSKDKILVICNKGEKEIIQAIINMCGNATIKKKIIIKEIV